MRRYTIFVLPALLLVALSVGCSGLNLDEQIGADSVDTQKTGTTVTAGASDSTSGPEATEGVASTASENESSGTGSREERPDGTSDTDPGGPPFVASTKLSGGSGYGADGILAVRYGIHEGYERVVVDLGTGKQPASSVPEWRLRSPSGDGLLRVSFPSVSMTRVSDGTFSGPLLRDFHVVRAPESGMFVDVLADSAFTYRVMELSNPARLVVDFKSSEATLDVPQPKKGGNTVLIEPRAGAGIKSPLTISGYSRNPEAQNIILLTNSAGEVIMEKTVLSNDWTATWGYFEATLDVPPFSGEGTLRVGAESARDGTFTGVEIPVHGG